MVLDLFIETRLTRCSIRFSEGNLGWEAWWEDLEHYKYLAFIFAVVKVLYEFGFSLCSQSTHNSHQCRCKGIFWGISEQSISC
ncbi:MAG: hypothetical protein ACFFB3_24575, partial [Candidatus Hodarchaeota archaeon]